MGSNPLHLTIYIMHYYRTTVNTYNDFVSRYNHSRLSKTEKLTCNVSRPKFLPINEIFDREMKDMEYTTHKYPHSDYPGENNITYIFNTDSGNEYRLDLVILMEDDTTLKNRELLGKKFISVSFSLADTTEENYDTPTNLNETYELMSRLRYLITLNEHLTDEGYVFMFGRPTDDKLRMYEYFVKKCFPDYHILIDTTTGFPSTSTGYYLIKPNDTSEV